MGMHQVRAARRGGGTIPSAHAAQPTAARGGAKKIDTGVPKTPARGATPVVFKTTVTSKAPPRG